MYRKNLFICNVDTESKLFSKHLDIIYKLYEKYKYDDFVFILFPNKSIETLSINIEEKDLKKYQPILSCIMQISKKQEKEFKK
jgi:glutathione peroxidase-family protein